MRGRQYGRLRVYRIETDGAAKKAGKEEGKRKRERGGERGEGKRVSAGKLAWGRGRAAARGNINVREIQRERERERDDIKFLSSPICK